MSFENLNHLNAFLQQKGVQIKRAYFCSFEIKIKNEAYEGTIRGSFVFETDKSPVNAYQKARDIIDKNPEISCIPERIHGYMEKEGYQVHISEFYEC